MFLFQTTNTNCWTRGESAGSHNLSTVFVKSKVSVFRRSTCWHDTLTDFMHQHFKCKWQVTRSFCTCLPCEPCMRSLNYVCGWVYFSKAKSGLTVLLTTCRCHVFFAGCFSRCTLCSLPVMLLFYLAVHQLWQARCMPCNSPSPNRKEMHSYSLFNTRLSAWCTFGSLTLLDS